MTPTVPNRFFEPAVPALLGSSSTSVSVATFAGGGVGVL
jgi:hypothetical protein